MLEIKSIILLLLILLLSGCTVIEMKKSNRENLSCREEVQPKSLQYLEQQYRCHSDTKK